MFVNIQNERINEHMNQEKKKSVNPLQFLYRILQGALIGLGAVLPGISGGVLSVIFGIYKPIMELLSNPFKNFKSHVPPLIPVFIGGVIGFLGVANVLAFFLEKYPDPSVCVFIGLITGMLPSLFREAGEQGRSKGSFISMVICMIVIFALLIGLQMFSIEVKPIGAVVTVICLAKAINALFDNFYSIAFHGIIGIVIAATVMIIPVSGFMNAGTAIVNIICIAAGIVIALLLDKFNSRVKVE